MWWIAPTISRFGGFHGVAAFFLLLLYSALGALQFYLSGRLSGLIVSSRFCLDKLTSQHFLPWVFILIWMLLEILFPRLFPWGLGDFFISWKYFSSLSELIGSRGCSLLVLLMGLSVFRVYQNSISRSQIQNTYEYIPASSSSSLFVTIIIFLSSVFGIGIYLHNRSVYEDQKEENFRALVVQGNLDIYKKGNLSFFEANISTYQSLTENGLIALDGSGKLPHLIIWPETVMNKWTPSFVNLYPDSSFDPFPGLSFPLLYGSLAYDLKEGEPESAARFYNAALLRDSQGELLSFYGKRILMPFGEYVPFSEIFPWMKKLVPIGGSFSVGPVTEPLLVPLSESSLGGGNNSNLKVGVLICYEDLSAELSRKYARSGAQVLVNLTNDAWYGDSPAPFQHDLLARFRAIETRKHLIRATNTGLTSHISPSGEILKSLPLFEPASETFEFKANTRLTWYAVLGDLPLYSFLGLLSMFLFFKLFCRNQDKKRTNFLKNFLRL